jgi:hypothetical protein
MAHHEIGRLSRPYKSVKRPYSPRTLANDNSIVKGVAGLDQEELLAVEPVYQVLLETQQA